MAVVSSAADCAASSLAAVLASTGANAVPLAADSDDSAASTCSLLLVKSVSTCSDDPIAATATRSAVVMRSCTHLAEPSIAFCTSSGSIELVSKSSVIKRWPATSSEVSGCDGTGDSSTATAVDGVRPAIEAAAASAE